MLCNYHRPSLELSSRAVWCPLGSVRPPALVSLFQYRAGYVLPQVSIIGVKSAPVVLVSEQRQLSPRHLASLRKEVRGLYLSPWLLGVPLVLVSACAALTFQDISQGSINYSPIKIKTKQNGKTVSLFYSCLLPSSQFLVQMPESSF